MLPPFQADHVKAIRHHGHIASDTPPLPYNARTTKSEVTIIGLRPAGVFFKAGPRDRSRIEDLDQDKSENENNSDS